MNEYNTNHKRNHTFFIGSYSEQNVVTYALRMERGNASTKLRKNQVMVV